VKYFKKEAAATVSFGGSRKDAVIGYDPHKK
jgi:hypothetical protein